MTNNANKRCLDWIAKVLPRVTRHLKQKEVQEARNILAGTSSSQRPSRSQKQPFPDIVQNVWCPPRLRYLAIPEYLFLEIARELRRGRKIPAIKLLRAGYKDPDYPGMLGLKDAKEMIEFGGNWVR